MKQFAIITCAFCFVIGCAQKNQITDRDDNVYHAVTIGTQTWMVENLKTTHYNDGKPIPLVEDSLRWENRDSAAYCWYKNDLASYKAAYGALYNWYAVNTGKLAPKGWHVPTDSEWTVLTTLLGGEAVAGGLLKEAGTVHWVSPNTVTANAYGFMALPGGYRSNWGFTCVGTLGYWWSAAKYDSSVNSWERESYERDMSNTYLNVYRRSEGRQNGYSVRCVKDK